MQSVQNISTSFLYVSEILLKAKKKGETRRHSRRSTGLAIYNCVLSYMCACNRGAISLDPSGETVKHSNGLRYEF